MIIFTEHQERLRAEFDTRFEALAEAAAEPSETFPSGLWKVVRGTGLLALPFDERCGGGGEGLVTLMCLLELLGERCRDGGLGFSISTHMVSSGVPLQRFGSPELQARYLRRICAGDAIGAHAITEPEGGSDALRMRTTAVRDGSWYVLDGHKALVTNAPVADLFVVYARTHPAGGSLGISAFLVERDTPGFVVGPPVPAMGLHSAPLGELRFAGCRVPADNLVGTVGGGFRVLDHVMKWEVLCSFAIVAGSMAHRLRQCVEYARRRQQFGRPIGSFQAISHRIVDMKIGLETTRRWLYDAAAVIEAGGDATAEVAIAKLVASESNIASAMSAIQIFGGLGYLSECGLEADLRDAIGGTIYSGTSEIQRNRIASTLGLQPSTSRPGRECL